MEKKAGGEGEKTNELGSEYDDVEIGGLSITQGGINPDPVGSPPPILPATPEYFVCLQGPCIHYWELKVPFEAGNPADTWEALGRKPPTKVHRTCLLNPGHETSFGESNALACSRHTPMLVNEVRERQHRLDNYYRLNPEHKPEPEEEFFSDADTSGTES